MKEVNKKTNKRETTMMNKLDTVTSELSPYHQKDVCHLKIGNNKRLSTYFAPNGQFK